MDELQDQSVSQSKNEPSTQPVGMRLADVRVHAAIKSFLEHSEISLGDVRVHSPIRENGPAESAEEPHRRPGSSVVILTANENLDYLFKAMEEGAFDRALGNASREELDLAVRQVLRGESPLDPERGARLLQKAADSKAVERPEPLTPRQMDVLRLLAKGLTNREIAQRLVLSTGTVRTHVQHIIAKLGVSDRTGAVVRGIELGLVTADSSE